MSGASSSAPAALEPAWYCLNTQPKHEAIAATLLRRLPEIEVFCPRLRFERPRKARAGYADSGRTWVTEALFPGYIFAHFEAFSRYREIRSVHGVRGIVRFGDKFQAVPAALIEQLRASVRAEENAANGESGADAGDNTTITVAPDPQPGQEIVVAEGPFAGLRALVTRYLPARQRVCVLLEFLGREMEAEVPATRVIAPMVAHPLRRDPSA